MSLSYVQSLNAGGGSAGFASGASEKVLKNPCAPDNAVALLVFTLGGNPNLVNVTSPMGEFVRISPITEIFNWTDLYYSWWACLSASAAYDTATVTQTGLTFWDAVAIEFSGGAASAGFVDGGGSGAWFGNQTLTPSVEVSPDEAGAAVLVYMQDNGGYALGTPPGSPWTNLIGAGLSGYALGAWDALSWTVTPGNNPVTATWELTGGSAGYSGFTGGAPWWGGLALILQPVPGPTVTSVSPSAGVAGNTVTVTGTNLSTATAVNFGSTSAVFEVVSAEEITATAPAGSGTVDITVVAPAGTSETSSADQFAYMYAGPYAVTVALSQAVATVSLT